MYTAADVAVVVHEVLELCLSGGTPSALTGQQGTLLQPHCCTGTSSSTVFREPA